jgi:hypothetical protein
MLNHFGSSGADEFAYVGIWYQCSPHSLFFTFAPKAGSGPGATLSKPVLDAKAANLLSLTTN